MAEYFDIVTPALCPGPRRPETRRLVRELRSGTNTWSAIVVGESTRAFGAPIQYSTTYPLLQHFGIELWLPEIGGRVDFTGNLVSAIEAGTDPTVINPRIAQLRAEREQLSRQLANLDAPDRLSPADIDALLTELSGLAHILGEATPLEKAGIYQGLGLHLVYQPDQHALVATADLGRVLGRVGGGTSTPTTRPRFTGEVVITA